MAMVAVVFGIGTMGCQQQSESAAVDAPTGKTGNEWTEDDFADSKSDLALKGGPEFVDVCKEAGNCELEGDILEKFKEILKKYPVKSERRIRSFSGRRADAVN